MSKDFYNRFCNDRRKALWGFVKWTFGGYKGE